ncbi:MAG TPA: hypothetical protein H9903_12140 [Candidatus Aquabacterium excrementipullorum]|nr:hypothetical protein [Candidatus Aquabacterium excrementipullorum]
MMWSEPGPASRGWLALSCSALSTARLMAVASAALISPPVLAEPADFDFLSFGAIVNFHSDKQWCDEHYPAFRLKNDAIFADTIFGRDTAESFIDKHANGDLKQHLLSALPRIRAERQSEYASMPPTFLQDMCSHFDNHLGKDNLRPQDGLVTPPPKNSVGG